MMVKLGTTPQEAKRELLLTGLRESFYDRLRSLGGWLEEELCCFSPACCFGTSRQHAMNAT